MSSKDAIIADLRKLVEKQAIQLDAQAKQIDALTQELDELKIQLAKANKNSSNSSKSPSNDITGPGKKKGSGKPGRPKKRTIGGQPGHDRKLREPLPPERVDETIEYEIHAKEVEQLGLIPTDQFDAIQTIELPDCPVIVTEHWVWCISSAILTLFHIATNRSRAILEELVGEEFKGYLNFDYFSANCSFAWNYEIKAQYCWAHLIRDMRFLLKLPDKNTQVWAERLLDRRKRPLPPFWQGR